MHSSLSGTVSGSGTCGSRTIFRSRDAPVPDTYSRRIQKKQTRAPPVLLLTDEGAAGRKRNKYIW